MLDRESNSLRTTKRTEGFTNYFPARAASIADLNAVYGCAPTTGTPLIKTVGVPFTPAFCPSDKSACTSFAYLPLSTQSLNWLELSPKVAANFLRLSLLNVPEFSCP